MARQKKLNKRVVLLLVVFGVVLLAFGGAIVIPRLPKDPKVCEKLGDELMAKRDFPGAESAYNDAIRSAGTGIASTPYLFKKARLELQWATTAVNLTDTDRAGRLTQTVNLLRNVLRKDAKHIDAQRLLCDMFWQPRDFFRRPAEAEAFISEADKLIALDDQDHQAYFRRAVAKSQARANKGESDFNDALADFKKAIALKKDEPAYWMGLISFYSGNNKRPEAEAAYEEAIAAVPDNPEIRINYAEYLYRWNRKDDARKQCMNAIEKAPASPIGRMALASLYFADGKLDEAKGELEQARRLDDTQERIYQEMARIHLRQNNPEVAVKALRDGLDAITRRAQSVPTSRPAAEIDRLRYGRFQLNVMLANALLDMIDSASGAENEKALKEKFMPEIRQCLDQVSDIRPNSAQEAKIAGRIALADGKNLEATRWLEKSDRLADTVDMVTSNLLIRLYLTQRQPGLAEKVVNRILAIPEMRSNPSALLLKAKLMIEFREFFEATKYLDRILQVDANNAEARNLKMVVAAATGSRLPADIQLSRQAADLMVERAIGMWVEGQQDQAVTLLEDLNKKMPNNPGVINRLVGMYRQLKRIDDARKLLDDAIKADPNDAQLATQRKLIEEPDPQKQLEMRLQMTEGIADPKAQAMERANIYAEWNKDEEYAAQLKKAASLDIQTPGVAQRLLRYALAKKDWTLAEEMAAKARENDLDGVGGKLYLANVLTAQAQFPEAVSVLQKVLEQRPDLKNAQIMLADCYLRSKNFEKAETELLKIVDADPSYVPAVVGLAQAYELEGKMDKSAEWIERAHQLMPSDPYVQLRYLEQREEQAQNLDDIIRQREQILKRSPDDRQNRFRLALLYERTGRLQEAEDMQWYIFEHSPDKLASTRVLISFLDRIGRSTEVDQLARELLRDTKDKVGAYVLYGEFLARHSASQAEEAFNQAVQADPNDPRPYLAKARFFAAQGKYSEAAKEMEHHLKLPQASGSEKDLVRYLINTDEAGELEKASGLLDQMIAKDASDSEALMLKGLLAVKRKDIKKAEDFLTRAVQASPNSAVPLVQRSRLYIVEGELKKARADLQAAKLLNNSPETTLDLAQVLTMLHDYDEAGIQCTEVYSRRRNDKDIVGHVVRLLLNARPPNWTRLEPILAEARKTFPRDQDIRMLEGEMWRRRGDVDRSIASLEEAVKIGSVTGEIMGSYLQSLLNTKQYDKVLSVSKDYVDRAEFKPWLTAMRGTALAKLGQAAEAETMFLAAFKEAQSQQLGDVIDQMVQAYELKGAIGKLNEWLKDRPADWRMCYFLGELYRKDKDWAKSISMLGRALELAGSPEDKAQVNSSLATAHYQNNDVASAEKAYLAAVQAMPEDPATPEARSRLLTAVNNLAYLYVENMNKPDLALPYAEKAVRLAPSRSDVLDTYGWTLAKLGKLDLAQDALLRAILSGDPPPDMRYHLGWVYEQQNKLDDALRQYRPALDGIDKTDPLHKVLGEAVARLEKKASGSEK